MNFPIFVATKYLFSFKKKNIINIISGISTMGVMISTSILIIVLSIFNGFEKIIHTQIDAFNVDLHLLAKQGKRFIPSSKMLSYLTDNKDINQYSRILQEQVLLKNNKKQKPIIIKGVEASYIKMLCLDSFLYVGEVFLQKNEKPFAIVGYSIAQELDINPYSLGGVAIYAANKDKNPGLNIQSALRKRSILVSGVIIGDPQFTNNYILVPIQFATELLGYKKEEISAIEIQLKDKKKIRKLQKKLQKYLGNSYLVKTKLELNSSIYKMLKTEKISIFSILLFVLVIFAFNMLASLAMLIIDKRKDIQIMLAMGANLATIKRIFWIEGVLIVFVGLFCGMIIGLGICLLQHHYGIIEMSSSNYFAEYYPIKVKVLDVVYVFLLVLLIGYIAALLPVQFITKKYIKPTNI